VRQVAAARRREFEPAAPEMSAGDGEEASVAQLLFDQDVVQMAPGRALQDDLPLHQLVGYGPVLRAFDDVEVEPGAVARRVADHALDVAAHLLGRDLLGDGHAQESRRHHRDERDGTEINEFEPRIRLVDMVDDQIGVAVEEPLPRTGDGLDVEMQAGSRMAIEKGAEQGEHLRHRAEIADHDVELALLAHGELPRVVLQAAELLQEHARAVMEGAAGLGQRHAIAAAIEQGQAELCFEVLHRGENRRLRAPQLGGRGLEPAFRHDGVETLQLVKGEAFDHRVTLLRELALHSFYQISIANLGV
jgi:hypothetical protein